MATAQDNNTALRMWARTHMQAAYLQVMSSVKGVGAFDMSDTLYLDQLATRVDTLLEQRAQLENAMASTAGSHAGQDSVEAATSTAATTSGAASVAAATPEADLSTGNSSPVVDSVSDAEREAAEQAAVAAALPVVHSGT